jgi:predicted porin
MKKTLIAVAAIAAMGAASAQVTVYGKLDVGASSLTTDGETSQGTQFGSGNYETSRIGVKGSSDIAGGVKGVFQLEGALGATDGSFSNFGRVANLGLTGNFGTIAAGRMWTPYDSAFNDALEYNGFSAMGGAFGGGAHADNGMDGSGGSKNAFQYTTPTMGGLSAVLMYGSNADATAATEAKTTYSWNTKTGERDTTVTPAAAATSATNYASLGLNYASGPLTVNLATERVLTSLNNKVASGDSKGAGLKLASSSGSYTNAWILAGSYNLGVATLHAAAEGATADGFAAGSAKDTGSAVGVSVPVDKATTFALGYATESTTLSGYSDGKKTSTGLQVVYAWNAATAIYAGYRITDTTALGESTSVKGTKFATGVRYNF